MRGQSPGTQSRGTIHAHPLSRAVGFSGRQQLVVGGGHFPDDRTHQPGPGEYLHGTIPAGHGQDLWRDLCESLCSTAGNSCSMPTYLRGLRLLRFTKGNVPRGSYTRLAPLVLHQGRLEPLGSTHDGVHRGQESDGSHLSDFHYTRTGSERERWPNASPRRKVSGPFTTRLTNGEGRPVAVVAHGHSPPPATDKHTRTVPEIP